jgi:hypothetical protein
MPSLEDIRAVLIAGSGFGVAQGLLVTSPVLVAAGVGLVLLWRRGFRAEALVCGTAAVLFVLTTAGNEYPHGGHAPGPRYFAPALGLLAVGLPEAFRRWPRLVAGVAALSIGVMTFNALAWMENSALSLRHELPVTLWSSVGLPKEAGVAIVFVCAAAAAWVGFEHLLRRPVPEAAPVPGRA